MKTRQQNIISHKMFKHFRLPLLKFGTKIQTNHRFTQPFKIFQSLQKQSVDNLNSYKHLSSKTQPIYDQQLIYKLKIVPLLKNSTHDLLQIKVTNSMKPYKRTLNPSTKPSHKVHSLPTQKVQKKQISLFQLSKLKKNKYNHNDEQGLYVSKICASSRDIVRKNHHHFKEKQNQYHHQTSIYLVKANIEEVHPFIQQVTIHSNQQEIQGKQHMVELKSSNRTKEQQQNEQLTCSLRSSVKQKLMTKKNWKKFKKAQQDAEIMNNSIKGWTRYNQLQNQQIMH